MQYIRLIIPLLKHTVPLLSSIWPPLLRARWFQIFLNCSDLDWSEGEERSAGDWSFSPSYRLR